MQRRTLIIIAVVVVLVLAAGTAAAVVVKVRVSPLVKFTVAAGVVKESPEQVASSVSAALGRSVSATTAALATVIDSEAGGEPRAVRVAVGWAVFNKAGRSAGRVLSTIAPAGKFGSQNAGNHYVSSARPPSSDAVGLAEGILGGSIADPTKGAQYFDSPKAQRAALARGTKGYRKTPEQVAADRRAAGDALVLVAGVSEEQFRLWRAA